jgi:acyl carrier protein
MQGILPSYMIPVHLTKIEKIPLTKNGKINKRALPGPKLISNQTYFNPKNEIEEKLVEIWSDILVIKKSQIGLNDTFFDLGGNSLDIIKLHKSILKVFKIDLPIALLFKFTRITSLAEKIENRDNEEIKKNVRYYADVQDKKGVIRKFSQKKQRNNV